MVTCLDKPIVELQLGQHLNSSQLMEGNDVFFECQVKANPSVLRLSFYHNGAEVVQDLAAGVVVSDSILVMRQLRREQSGHYTCAATNQEGHNTSNAVHLLVQHAPVCAGAELQRTLGVARGTPVTVTCRVEAEPARHLSWSWVRTLDDGQEQPIPAADVESSGLSSSVEVMLMSTEDYGNLLCKASNIIGRQQEPCVVSLIPAGPPDPPVNCSASPSEPQDAATFTLSLAVVCFEGFDGGLPQQFLLEAWQNGHAMANMTRDFPEWEVNRLEGGLDTSLFIVAFNARGSSDKLLLEVPMARAQQQAAAPGEYTRTAVSDSWSDSSCDCKAETMVEVSELNQQCWPRQNGKVQANSRADYFTVPTRTSPRQSPLDSHVLLPQNGNLCSTPCHVTCPPPDTHVVIGHGNGCGGKILEHQRKRNLIPFKNIEKKVVLQHELQTRPTNRNNGRGKYELLHTARKPPRTFSQTSLPSCPPTRGSYMSLCSSSSQPVPHIVISEDPSEWRCPRAPLAVDEVQDAYVLS
ncbi:Neural cell adhesion molecule 1-B [Portunus trituberculatus]|uniref:Neural cell adhesion molecule 1-B n=1 Tax=Portunus trituberculatus TaxID=210409 RepID=A0A5B7GEL0_PORTR|nr:Neural cell adhesion molecule 1-B [Portunus trituberculatus]